MSKLNRPAGDSSPVNSSSIFDEDIPRPMTMADIGLAIAFLMIPTLLVILLDCLAILQICFLGLTSFFWTAVPVEAQVILENYAAGKESLAFLDPALALLMGWSGGNLQMDIALFSTNLFLITAWWHVFRRWGAIPDPMAGKTVALDDHSIRIHLYSWFDRWRIRAVLILATALVISTITSGIALGERPTLRDLAIVHSVIGLLGAVAMIAYAQILRQSSRIELDVKNGIVTLPWGMRGNDWGNIRRSDITGAAIVLVGQGISCAWTVVFYTGAEAKNAVQISAHSRTAEAERVLESCGRHGIGGRTASDPG